MEIQVVTDPNEMKNVMPVVRSAWGMNNSDQLIKDILCAFRFHGGLVMLAKDNNETIGIQFSFPGYKNGRRYLYSHMTGVLEGKKYGGVGRQLKEKQRQWAMENDYDLIAWTYDPLMNLNATFNIHKLGAISRTYLRDFYGEMEDTLNFGMPTDRFVAEWYVNKKEQARPKVSARTFSFEEVGNLDKSAIPDDLYLKIPDNYLEMKKRDPEKAMDQRLKSRNIFENLFSKGYIVSDFSKELNAYFLEKKPELGLSLGPNIFNH